MVLGIYGASGLGAEFLTQIDLVNQNHERWEEVFFIDDAPEKVGTELVGLPVLSFEQCKAKYAKEDVEFLLGIGEPAVKDLVFEKLTVAGYQLTNLFDPETRISRDCTLGRGIVVKRCVNIPTMSVIGNNVIIQGSAIMGHGIVLGDNVVVSAMAFIGGDTKVGRNTYIAPHACIRNGLHIGENAIIGMGAVVTKDVPDNAVVVGNPGKIIRYNEKGRVFSK